MSAVPASTRIPISSAKSYRARAAIRLDQANRNKRRMPSKAPIANRKQCICSIRHSVTRIGKRVMSKRSTVKMTARLVWSTAHWVVMQNSALSWVKKEVGDEGANLAKRTVRLK